MVKREEIFTRSVTSERITLRSRVRGPSLSAMCGKCGIDVDWLTVSELTTLAPADQALIADLISNGDLDIKMAADQIYVCKVSVARCLQKKLL